MAIRIANTWWGVIPIMYHWLLITMKRVTYKINIS